MLNGTLACTLEISKSFSHADSIYFHRQVLRSAERLCSKSILLHFFILLVIESYIIEQLTKSDFVFFPSKIV